MPSFSVTASGSPPLAYYWRRNGTPVGGPTGSSYSPGTVQLTDSGAQFSCLVSNAQGSILSSNAPLTVFASNAPGPIYSFIGPDGGQPSAALVQGPDGSFYGTTEYGGAYGYGTVFKMSPSGQLNTLASFNQTNGSYPRASLVFGADGNLYGTTSAGGTNQYYGSVFRITTNGILTSLASFDYTLGDYPQSALVQAADGAFYGTTTDGGSYYEGTVFKVTTNGELSTVFTFSPLTGYYPESGLVQGPDDSLYGTTEEGGGTNSYGTIYRLTTNGQFSTLVSFNNTNGSYPLAPLIFGADGNLYGTTSNGTNYYGTIFRVTTNGTLTTLVAFTYNMGGNPQGGLIQGADGYFYGTTAYGGYNGQGTVFRMASNGAITNFFSFSGSNGVAPMAGVVQGSDGNLYGTAQNGGLAIINGLSYSGDGVVFRVVLPASGVSLSTISGRVFNIGGGSGLPGVTVTAGTNSATSDINGNYTITGVHAGEYFVFAATAGYVFTPAQDVVVPPNASGVNFTATAQTYSVSGHVFAGGVGLSGVSFLGHSSLNTDANGAFSITAASGTDITLTPQFNGYVFNPASLDITVTNQNISNVNFFAYLMFNSVSRLSDGTLQFFITAPAGSNHIEASSNLINWVTIFATNSYIPHFRFVDTAATNYSHRFYRAVRP
jgi:uncharacterized repeat protein (TIGR03803 family)